MRRPSKRSSIRLGCWLSSTTGWAMKFRGSAVIFSANFFPFLARGLVAHQHSISAGFVGALDDELVEIFKHVFPVRLAGADVGRNIGQNRFLPHVKFDHVGDIRIDGFVVGHAGPHRVHQRHVAAAVGVHQPGHAQAAIGAEAERIKEVVIDAGGRSRPRAAGRRSFACRQTNCRPPGPDPRPVPPPSAGPGSCARNRPSCRCPASERRSSGCSARLGATCLRHCSRLCG